MDPLELLPAQLSRMIIEKVKNPQDPVGLLSLRLVSKQWKKAVDSVMESSNDEFSTEPVQHRGMNSIWEIREKYYFWNSATISKFLSKFEAHPDNPLIGSSVKFSFRLDVMEEIRSREFGQPVVLLMKRFGVHIKKLCITVYSIEHRNLDNFLEQFRSVVELATNLEELAIRFIGLKTFDFRRDNCILKNQPLPIVPNLKSFFFDGDGKPESMVDLQNILVRLCCNPDSLKTAEMIGVPIELTTFPNLETASVVVTRPEEDATNLMNSNWPLVRLIVDSGTNWGRVTPVDSVLRRVVHFKETLTSLWIRKYGASTTTLEVSPALPQLAYLAIPRRLVNFQFLGNMPNLKTLRICEDDDNVGPLLNFMETQASEYRIWTGLPTLGKVEVARTAQDGLGPPKTICKVYYREKIASSLPS